MIKDNFKEIENYLYDYNIIKGKIKDLELQLKLLKDEYKGINSMTIGDRLSKTNKNISPVEDEVIIKQEKIEYLEKEIREKKLLLDRLDNAIDSLDERDKQFIKLKYIDHKSNCIVAEVLNLSVDYITEKRKIVIKNIIKILV